jgi:hypothetical protein
MGPYLRKVPSCRKLMEAQPDILHAPYGTNYCARPRTQQRFLHGLVVCVKELHHTRN